MKYLMVICRHRFSLSGIPWSLNGLVRLYVSYPCAKALTIIQLFPKSKFHEKTVLQKVLPTTNGVVSSV